MNEITCKHCGSPAQTYVPIYTGPVGLAVDRLAGPTIDLCQDHVRRWSDLYRFEVVQLSTQTIARTIDALKAAYETLDEAIEYLPGGRQRVEAINSRNMVREAIIETGENVPA
jgi:hypothetical protein